MSDDPPPPAFQITPDCISGIPLTAFHSDHYSGHAICIEGCVGRDLAEQDASDIPNTGETAEHAHRLLECQLSMLSIK